MGFLIRIYIGAYRQKLFHLENILLLVIMKSTATPLVGCLILPGFLMYNKGQITVLL